MPYSFSTTVWTVLMAIKLLYSQPEVCVCLNGKQSKSFRVGLGLRQGCALTSLFFIIYMNWMDKLSRTDGCVTIGKCKFSRLLFPDDLVLLPFSESGLQHALNGFAAECDIAGIKISISNTEVLHHSIYPVQCSLQVGGVSLKQVEKFKYLGSHSRVMESKTKNWMFDQAKKVL